MDLEYGTIRVDKIITTAGEVDLSAVASPATQTDDGLMSAADKTKLDGVEAGAQVNTVTSVNGLTGDITVDASVNNISLAALPELP